LSPRENCCFRLLLDYEYCQFTFDRLLIRFSHLQVRYAATEIHPTKSARARGAYLRVSFKNTRETAQAINGWKLQRAVKFLENVQEHKEAVPMRRYAGGTGRAAQGTDKRVLVK
jgi:hypothetical protein